ncbi:MAG: MarR family transcriptional regulator [Candidatus Methanoperedens sp.]
MAFKILNLCILFLISAAIANAAPENYRTTYTIDIKENGSAIWNVEYRTLLTTKGDFDSFENYSKQLKSVYIPEFMELMQRSASEAASATARDMVARDFTGNTSIQSTPTGKYGIVSFSFTWTNFATLNPLNIGDVFAGGLYLSKDNTLIIKYPSGFTVEEVTPKPDQSRDELIWYGLRSFGAKEPRIIFSKPAFPWGTAAIIVAAITAIIATGFYFIKRRKENKNIAQLVENMEITEIDMMDVEERILKILKEGGGELYQSQIGRQLNLPKSSVSSALNQLHEKKLIIKIKKGRENLIRLV